MTRGMWFGRVMPAAAIVYVIVIIAAHGVSHVAAIGALVLALLVFVGLTVTRPDAGGRERHRDRGRRTP